MVAYSFRFALLCVGFVRDWAEKITETAEDITSLQGTKRIFQRHVKNIEKDLNTLINDLNLKNEDNITDIYALKSSYSDKVKNIKELDHSILNLLQ